MSYQKYLLPTTNSKDNLMDNNFAITAKPPYYIVYFSSQRTDSDNGYADMATNIENLARQQHGFLGLETVRNSDGFGITNSFWTDEESIKAWKANIEHQLAQKLGREKFYAHYSIRIAKVVREYGL